METRGCYSCGRTDYDDETLRKCQIIKGSKGQYWTPKNKLC